MNNIPYPQASFLTSAASEEGWPKDDVPELIVVGRSNVGKSTFINALTGKVDLARVSQTPGRTRLLNFFTLLPRLRLVDAPGYGYAKISKESREQWELMMNDYLTHRPNLRGALLCIDARHEPTKDDLNMIEYLKSKSVSFGLVFTKVDTLSFSQRRQLLQEKRKNLPLIDSVPVVWSLPNGDIKWEEDVVNAIKRLIWSK